MVGIWEKHNLFLNVNHKVNAKDCCRGGVKNCWNKLGKAKAI